MIPATTLCTLGSPSWTLALFETMCSQSLHVLRDLVSGSCSRWFCDLSESRRLDGGNLSFTPCTSSFWALDIVFNCTLVASLLLHRSIHVFRVSFRSWRGLFRVRLSLMPTTILSRVVHAIAEITYLGDRAESGDISIN